jgi:hypothetical protein
VENFERVGEGAKNQSLQLLCMTESHVKVFFVGFFALVGEFSLTSLTKGNDSFLLKKTDSLIDFLKGFCEDD